MRTKGIDVLIKHYAVEIDFDPLDPALFFEAVQKAVEMARADAPLRFASMTEVAFVQDTAVFMVVVTGDPK